MWTNCVCMHRCGPHTHTYTVLNANSLGSIDSLTREWKPALFVCALHICVCEINPAGCLYTTICIVAWFERAPVPGCVADRLKSRWGTVGEQRDYRRAKSTVCVGVCGFFWRKLHVSVYTYLRGLLTCIRLLEMEHVLHKSSSHTSKLCVYRKCIPTVNGY